VGRVGRCDRVRALGGSGAPDVRSQREQRKAVIVVPWFASAVDEYQRIDALVKAMMVADGLGMIAERGWRPMVNGDLARTYGTRVVVVMHRG
jgi:hypothetical protein